MFLQLVRPVSRTNIHLQTLPLHMKLHLAAEYHRTSRVAQKYHDVLPFLVLNFTFSVYCVQT